MLFSEQFITPIQNFNQVAVGQDFKPTNRFYAQFCSPHSMPHKESHSHIIRQTTAKFETSTYHLTLWILKYNVSTGLVLNL